MTTRLDSPHRAAPLLFGILSLGTVLALLVWDYAPGIFPVNAHNLLGAAPLVLVAVAYLAYQAVLRPSRAELFRAVLLALAFLLWAANQYWPLHPMATLWNDLAIALFVLDVFFVLIGWPAAGGQEVFAEGAGSGEEQK
jgi:hypothetical protein